MPELLHITTAYFDLSIWSKHVDDRRKLMRDAIQKRGSNPGGLRRTHVFRLAPHVDITGIDSEVLDNCTLPALPFTADRLDMHEPLFFENTQYQFEWLFRDCVQKAFVSHRLQQVCEAFRFVPARRLVPARLTGTFNTGNDIGWMRLRVVYETDEGTREQSFAFEVLPTKIDLHGDLPAMYEVIDRSYPLLRFSLAAKTGQNVSRGDSRGSFPVMWLANFTRLRQQFEQGLKVITRAPHNRLQTYPAYRKADRITGRISNRRGEQIRNDIASGRHERRYRTDRKRLSVDTLENRFVRMAVEHCHDQLVLFARALEKHNSAPDNQRFSAHFLDELECWQKPLRKMLDHSFLADVGRYRGRIRSSIVLQQKPGYGTIYRAWQELRFYLDAFGDSATMSMKPVSGIYEIWCFLAIRQILLDDLGFEEEKTHRPLRRNNYFEYQLEDGMAGSFRFRRTGDGVRARLAHEPRFRPDGKSIRSFVVSQTPDIVLEVEVPTAYENRRLIWIFDAKYRIAHANDPSASDCDRVPDDAINQMHRYRDALIRLSGDEQMRKPSKSRPVFGAFALYPEVFDQYRETNPYQEAIHEIGIGAFALLPDAQEHDGRSWLRNFLKEQIGQALPARNDYATQSISERLYVNDSSRIPFYGMEQTLYPDLALTVPLGGIRNRDKTYFERFINGTALWYHLPVVTFKEKFAEHVAQELRFLAIALTSPANTHTKQISRIWPIRAVTIRPRNELSVAQTGSSSSSDRPYFLFSLGTPLSLAHPVNAVPHRPAKNAMRLTTIVNGQ